MEVASIATNSTPASQARLACQVVAPSAMPPTVSMPPRTARRPASLAGANRDAWIAALPQSPRLHWTVALASHLAVLILVWTNSLLEHLFDQLVELFKCFLD